MAEARACVELCGRAGITLAVNQGLIYVLSMVVVGGVIPPQDFDALYAAGASSM